MIELSSEVGKYSYEPELRRRVSSGCVRTWGIPMRRFVRSPEPGDAHSVMCSEHNSRAFSRIAGRAAVGSLSSNTERTSYEEQINKV
jgi:hypothetical protein